MGKGKYRAMRLEVEGKVRAGRAFEEEVEGLMGKYGESRMVVEACWEAAEERVRREARRREPRFGPNRKWLREEDEVIFRVLKPDGVWLDLTKERKGLILAALWELGANQRRGVKRSGASVKARVMRLRREERARVEEGLYRGEAGFTRTRTGTG